MKILEIDYEYYDYPKGISCIEDFIAYANKHYNTFVRLTRFETENCAFPYFISEETKQVYVNIATMQKISEAEVTVLCRLEYDIHLDQVVKQKCMDCVHYEEDNEDDHLKGHREKISLDGECWGYEKKKYKILGFVQLFVTAKVRNEPSLHRNLQRHLFRHLLTNKTTDFDTKSVVFLPLFQGLFRFFDKAKRPLRRFSTAVFACFKIQIV